MRACRVYFGPDSEYAEFAADTCSKILGLPSCAEWKPNPLAFLTLLTQQAPAVLGGWCLIALVAASMSTSDGAILALGTVFSHNVLRQFTPIFPKLFKNDGSLLWLTRVATLPFAVIAGAIAAFSAGITGKLLIVAFDVVLATVIAPLFGAFYSLLNYTPISIQNGKDNFHQHAYSSCAALLSFVAGAITRIVLEFTLPKDDSFLLPYNVDEFRSYGETPSLKLPTFLDANDSEIWNPASEPCKQDLWKDYTGVDSLVAFAVSIVVFVVIQLIENCKRAPLFRFPGDIGYEKGLAQQSALKQSEDEKAGNNFDSENEASLQVDEAP